MKRFARDIGLIAAAVVAGVLYANAVHAHGPVYKGPQAGWHGKGHGHYHGRQKAYRYWPHRQHSHGRHDRPRVVYIHPPAVVTVPGPVVVQNADYCREYSSTAIVGGRRVPVYGTACRRPDGSWQFVD